MQVQKSVIGNDLKKSVLSRKATVSPSPVVTPNIYSIFAIDDTKKQKEEFKQEDDSINTSFRESEHDPFGASRNQFP